MLVLLLAAMLQLTQDPTLPPDARVLRVVEGRGVQVYTCKQTTQAFEWTLLGPEAQLLEPDAPKNSRRAPLGTHSTGPTWTWADGSSVQGKVLAKAAAADAHDLPWLLLSAQSVSEAAQGFLSPVVFVRRSETHGGVAPLSGCDRSHLEQSARVPYSATYTFYVVSSR